MLQGTLRCVMNLSVSDAIHSCVQAHWWVVVPLNAVRMLPAPS